MDIPKGFRLEHGIEEKTEDLLEGKVKQQKQIRPIVEKKELEEMLRAFDKQSPLRTLEFVYKKIDRTLEKNYQPVKSQKFKTKWKYWAKQDPYFSEESHVMIRYLNRQGRGYAFARVESKNLEDFCRSFEKTQLFLNKYIPQRHLGRVIGGVLLGVFLYSSVKYGNMHYQVPYPGAGAIEIISSVIGVLAGALFGESIAVNLPKKIYERKIKKLETYSTELILDTKKAVGAALG